MSFGWKRKIGSNVSKVKTETFSSETKDEESPDVDWLTSAPKRKFVSLEDARSKSERLQAEGTVLAEAERSRPLLFFKQLNQDSGCNDESKIIKCIISASWIRCCCLRHNSMYVGYIYFST